MRRGGKKREGRKEDCEEDKENKGDRAGAGQKSDRSRTEGRLRRDGREKTRETRERQERDKRQKGRERKNSGERGRRGRQRERGREGTTKRKRRRPKAKAEQLCRPYWCGTDMLIGMPAEDVVHVDCRRWMATGLVETLHRPAANTGGCRTRLAAVCSRRVPAAMTVQDADGLQTGFE